MLTLTPAATEVVVTMAEASSEPGTGGLRIATSGDTDLAVEFVAGPADQDEVLLQDGARVFLEPETMPYLDDKVLDAAADGEGRVQFALGQRSGDDQAQPR
jgi:iron-sulfur cluster assembly protein